MWVGFPGTELSEGTLLEIYDKNEKCIIVLRTYTFSNFIAYEPDRPHCLTRVLMCDILRKLLKLCSAKLSQNH